MRKISILILTSFISAGLFVFAPALVFAKDNQNMSDLRVYYKEPIAGGEKVYHITACTKKASYAPLRCAKENANKYKQCKYKDGPVEKINEGTPVKGCLTGAKGPGDYPAVDPVKYGADQCGGDSAQVGYKYVPEYAVIDSASVSNPTSDEGPTMGSPSEWKIKGTIAWENENVPPGIVNQIVKDGVVHPLYRAAVCSVWDMVAINKDGKSGSSVSGEDKKNASKVPNSENIALDLIKAGCNNNNATANEEYGIEASTAFEDKNPYVTCSTQYRITGKSGADIFGKYVALLYKWAAGIVGIVSVLIIVFSGIQISTAGGESGKIDLAKTRIMQSLAGLAILFLASLILYTINPGFFTG